MGWFRNGIQKYWNDEKMKLITSHVYRKVNKQPQFRTETQEVNAAEFAQEMIKHTYREGWGW
jgi:hypothetical protein